MPKFTDSTTDLLQHAFPIPGKGVESPDALAEVRAAQLKLYAVTQYRFYVAFQALVLVLAVVALVALVICIARVMDGTDMAAILGGVGAVVTGAGAAFIQKQATDAKDRYMEALKLLEA